MLNKQDAQQIALGLRALETNPNHAAVFKAVAANLGLISIGENTNPLEFDPMIHQDIDGGILPGTLIKIKLCGWSINGILLLRAHVIRLSP